MLCVVAPEALSWLIILPTPHGVVGYSAEFNKILHQGFMGEKFGRDTIWETHLSEELWMTHVDLTVILDEQILSLGQIFELKVGSQLKLKATPKSLVDIRCGPMPVFRGLMGRKDENIAIKISEKLIKEVE